MINRDEHVLPKLTEPVGVQEEEMETYRRVSDQMKYRVALTLSFALAVTVAAPAQETDPGSAEIVVSASRTMRTAGRIPANVTVITSEDIDQAGSVSLVDVLNNLEGIYFRTMSGNASQARINMRGFSENSHGYVLVLLDGRKLNNADMSDVNWSQIPLNNIERVEVMRGSQTALYGDYALGGVVNIVTKRGTPVPEYLLSAIGGSYGLNIQRLSVAGAADAVSYAANFERNQLTGYRDRSAYLAWGGGANIGFDINEVNNLNLALAYNDMSYEIPGYLTMEQIKENPRQSMFPDDSAENKYYNADLGVKSLLNDALQFDMNIVYGRKDSVSDMTSWYSFSDFIIDTYGATPRLTVDSDLFDHGNTFLAGFDGYLDKLDARRYDDLERTFQAAAANISKRTLGGYARNEFSIMDQLVLDLGARVDQARYDADVPASAIDDVKTYNASSVSAALIYLLADDSKVFTRAGTVYRFPFVDELISYAGFADDIYTDLEMEKGQNYEVGADLALLEGIRAGLTLFLMDMKDQIAWNEVTYRNSNLDDTRHMGAEARAGWAFRDICRLDAWYTYIRTRFTNGEFDGNDVPLVPNHKVSLAASLFLPYDLTFKAVVSCAGSQYLGGDNANDGEKLSDYTVVDLVLRYTPEFAAQLGLEAFAGVDNVFSEKYATAGYRGWSTDGYYPSPERSFKAGLSCRF